MKREKETRRQQVSAKSKTTKFLNIACYRISASAEMETLSLNRKKIIRRKITGNCFRKLYFLQKQTVSTRRKEVKRAN